ncbi:putative sulfate exporter family transporter, partial [Megamonas funiformis]
ILYFIIASIITTFLNYFMDRNIFSTEISSAILSFFALMKFCSKYFIIMAMGAIGLHTDIVDLIKNGGRPIIMGFCCWIAIACVSLLVQHLLGLW